MLVYVQNFKMGNVFERKHALKKVCKDKAGEEQTNYLEDALQNAITALAINNERFKQIAPQLGEIRNTQEKGVKLSPEDEILVQEYNKLGKQRGYAKSNLVAVLERINETNNTSLLKNMKDDFVGEFSSLYKTHTNSELKVISNNYRSLMRELDLNQKIPYLPILLSKPSPKTPEPIDISQLPKVSYLEPGDLHPLAQNWSEKSKRELPIYMTQVVDVEKLIKEIKTLEAEVTSALDVAKNDLKDVNSKIKELPENQQAVFLRRIDSISNEIEKESLIMTKLKELGILLSYEVDVKSLDLTKLDAMLEYKHQLAKVPLSILKRQIEVLHSQIETPKSNPISSEPVQGSPQPKPDNSMSEKSLPNKIVKYVKRQLTHYQNNQKTYQKEKEQNLEKIDVILNKLKSLNEGTQKGEVTTEVDLKSLRTMISDIRNTKSGCQSFTVMVNLEKCEQALRKLEDTNPKSTTTLKR